MTARPVIVGVDGADRARDAVALGRRLADALRAPLDVVAASGSSPDRLLHDAAVREGAVAIVLGSTARGRIGRIVPGGTARRLLEGAACPVAVAPAGYADLPRTRFRRIGAGFEPTPEGHAALAQAHRLAASTGAELHAVGVVLPLAPIAIDDWRDPATFLLDEELEVRAALESALEPLRATVTCVADARVDDPAVQLADASHGLDLLGRGPVRAALLGSVNKRVLRTAACPLLIVPQPHTARAAPAVEADGA